MNLVEWNTFQIGIFIKYNIETSEDVVSLSNLLRRYRFDEDKAILCNEIAENYVRNKEAKCLELEDS